MLISPKKLTLWTKSGSIFNCSSSWNYGDNLTSLKHKTITYFFFNYYADITLQIGMLNFIPMLLKNIYIDF